MGYFFNICRECVYFVFFASINPPLGMVDIRPHKLFLSLKRTYQKLVIWYFCGFKNLTNKYCRASMNSILVEKLKTSSIKLLQSTWNFLTENANFYSIASFSLNFDDKIVYP